MLGLTDPLVALLLDDALALRLLRHQTSNERADDLPFNTRFESDDDLNRPLHDPAKAAESRALFLAKLREEGIKTH